jgi:protoporphyrinogen/coproporphyrinogen III oxidase
MSIEEFKDRRRLGDGQLFITFLSGNAGSEMADWEQEAIVPVVLAELDKYLPGISSNVMFTKIYRWREALAMSPLGRARSVARYRQSAHASTKVFLAGDYMGMPFTEGAAETGKWAAEALMRTLA